MIKLDVRDYCHECPIFSPYLKVAPQRIDGGTGAEDSERRTRKSVRRD